MRPSGKRARHKDQVFTSEVTLRSEIVDEAIGNTGDIPESQIQETRRAT
jgi:hypothetical protein